MTLVVRTADAPAPLAGTVRQVVQRLDPTQAAYEMKTFETILDEALAQRMFGMSLFAGFAGLALILAAVGLYAVMTQLVNGRLHEMGVRMALGAPPASVRRLIGRQAIVLLAAGTAVGLPAAVVSARLLGSLLYDVNPGDPTTLAAVVAVLAAAVAIAAYLPARRATRVDAVSVLRS
jgi:ABC-type antimicrobial peptide transport system permease subunit